MQQIIFFSWYLVCFLTKCYNVRNVRNIKMFEIFTILNQCFAKYFYAEKNLSALAIENITYRQKKNEICQ